MTRLHRILRVSRIAPGISPEAVGAIFGVARRRNPALGVTGALVFDGECFAQLIEGERHVVRALAQRIGADPRHADLRVLFDGDDAEWPRLPHWSAGWAPPDGVPPLLQAPAPLGAFFELLVSCDLA